jgi:hypothetical protein
MTAAHIAVVAGFVSLIPFSFIVFRRSLNESLYLDGRRAFYRGERQRLHWPPEMRRGYRDARGEPHSSAVVEEARRRGGVL